MPVATVKHLLGRDADGDNDNPKFSAYDGDDGAVRSYGHHASPAEARQAASLLKSYYAAAAASNGTKACPLLYGIIAETMAEEYEHILNTKTCATTMSKLFSMEHGRFVRDNATFKFESLHVAGSSAKALITFGSPIEHLMLMHRERKDWKLRVVFDTLLP